MKYLFSITLALFVFGGFAQPSPQAVALPEVFLIGEYEDQYLDLAKAHPAQFISIFNNDIEKAYSAWSTCLLDMEDYAAQLNFDLKGVKLWLNLYFNADGSIANLSFFPKPNSRNVPDAELIAFFKNFVRHYKLPVKAEKGFQHSTTASFPTFYDRADLARHN